MNRDITGLLIDRIISAKENGFLTEEEADRLIQEEIDTHNAAQRAKRRAAGEPGV